MNDTAALWQQARTLLSGELTATAVETWFGDAQLAEFSPDRVIMTTPNQVKQGLIRNKYADILRKVWKEIFAADMEVLLMTEGEYRVYLENLALSGDSAESEFTFEHFVVGTSNTFAHAAALYVSDHPGGNYNPLLIHGPSGVGKTHLLLAIADKVKKAHPDWKIVYKSAEDFTNDMVAALRNGKMQEFRDYYRQCHLLLIDDIQFIAGKDSTQEEFFYTFNSLREVKHQIVLTSDRPPKEINRIDDRIRSRLENGVLADIGAPDYELRCAIIYKKCEFLSFTLSSDVVHYLADHIKSNVRQLEGAVKKIKALHDFMDMPLNIETAQAAINDIYRENPGINPTPEYIIETVAKFFGMTSSDITGTRRGQDVVFARQCAIYLTRTLTKLSFPEIGAAFGGRDHTTIMHSVKKIEDAIHSDEATENNINLMIKAIRQE